MAQYNPGDDSINPNSTSGTDLADIINRLTSATTSGNSGVARPAYAVLGTYWVDSSAPPESIPVYFFDGVQDVLMYTFNSVTGVLTPGFATQPISVSPTPPSTPGIGELWLNSSTLKLMWYDSVEWQSSSEPMWVFPIADHAALDRENILIGNFNVTLPAAPIVNSQIRVSNIDATWDGTKIIGGNGHNIEGAASYSLDSPKSITLVYSGIQWEKLTEANLSSDVTANLAVGYTTNVEVMGNSGTGTIVPDITAVCQKTLTVDGSFTLAAPTGNGYMEIRVTNDAVGGYAITVSAYTLLSGTYKSAANAVSLFRITRIGSASYLEIVDVT